MTILLSLASSRTPRKRNLLISLSCGTRTQPYYNQLHLWYKWGVSDTRATVDMVAHATTLLAEAKMIRAKSIAAVLWILAASPGFAQEHQHADGEKLGSVHFATSCNQPAQTKFNRAVALLHSFQFSRAIQEFNAVIGEDATCGIAYWGISLSDWSNPFAPGMKDSGQLKLGRESAERGKSVGAKTERERAYLAAVSELYADSESTPQRARILAYRDAMEDVAGKYPQDHEAQIFYALALAASEDPADKTYVGRLKAGAILEKLFQEVGGLAGAQLAVDVLEGASSVVWEVVPVQGGPGWVGPRRTAPGSPPRSTRGP